MSFGYYYNLNNRPYPYQNPNFRADNNTAASAPLAKPIKTVQKSIESSVDTFVKKVDEEKKKKSNKTAIAVGSSVLVITGLVALLNPKYSSKLVSKLKNMSQTMGNKVETSKNNYIASKLHKASKKTLDWGIRTLEFTNNINSAKDIGFKYICCEKKGFHGIKNKSMRSFLQKLDNGFTKVMSKFHKTITKWFDGISKSTVRAKYNQAAKKMDSLESLIKQYKGKLPVEEQRQLEAKLAEITQARQYISDKNIAQRLTEQEKMMDNLERDFLKKYRSYKKGFSNPWINKTEHIDKNMTFWAEKIMQPTRDKVELQGLESIEKIIGNGKDKKGFYDEIYTMLSPHITREEKTALETAMKKAGKKLHKANHSECVEYFDKKRDLILGSAPTDIVTAIAGLGLSGAAIAAADTKEDRISRALTGGFPIVAGIGASLAFTAMLFSGVQGMLLGAGTSIALSKAGSLADHYILGNKKDTKEENNPKPTNNPFQPQEVVNA